MAQAWKAWLGARIKIMMCVLRVGGSALDLNEVTAISSVIPFRMDKKGQGRAKINSLHYDVVKEFDGTFSEMLEKATQWLKGTKGIEKLKTRGDVEHLDLDFAVFAGEDQFGTSYTLPSDFLRIAGELGLSVTVSVYKKQEN